MCANFCSNIKTSKHAIATCNLNSVTKNQNQIITQKSYTIFRVIHKENFNFLSESYTITTEYCFTIEQNRKVKAPISPNNRCLKHSFIFTKLVKKEEIMNDTHNKRKHNLLTHNKRTENMLSISSLLHY